MAFSTIRDDGMVRCLDRSKKRNDSKLPDMGCYRQTITYLLLAAELKKIGVILPQFELLKEFYINYHVAFRPDDYEKVIIEEMTETFYLIDHVHIGLHIAARDGLPTIESYMALHQHDENANQIWIYFRRVIEWVETIFPVKRREMKGIEWGLLYNEYKDIELDPSVLEAQIKKLMMDDDVTNKKGIYTYILTNKEHALNIRAFTPSQKREAYERQNGICLNCNNFFEFEEMEGDHIKPWHAGGKTDAKNCQMLCRECNRRKSGK